mgnify:FL=1
MPKANPARDHSVPAPPSTVTPTGGLPSWLAIAVLAAVTLAAYWPALTAGFVWDDNAHVTAPALRSLAGLRRIWFEVGATQQFYPLLHTAFWIEHRLWGDAPLGYHLLNIALHVGAACLFALVLRRLTIPGAWLAAAIFALHPVHVESVAWISEQKNTLSTLFYLGATLAYLRFDVWRRPTHYALASGLFVLALSTKTVTASLPAALLVIFWWQRGRLAWRRDVAPLLPWFTLSVAAGVLTAWIERKLIGAEGAAFALAPIQRLELAGRALAFYLGKLLWPSGLIFIYPRWSLDPASVGQWIPSLGTVGVAAWLWHRRASSRAGLAAFLFFTGSLFPALGFFNLFPFTYSFVADHFQYLASLGVIALAGAALARLAGGHRFAGGMLVASLLLILGTLTWRQSRTYHDASTLFRTTIARNPACWMACNNLGKEFLANPAQISAAIPLFERALQLRPDYAEAESNLGLALTQTGRPREAIPHLEKSLRLKPGLYQTHNNLGIALASAGRAQEALAAFAEAARLNPYLPNIQENWGKALLLLDRQPEAAEHFAAAARLRARP